MSMTLLQLVQQACGELGLAVPASVVGNPSADPTQFLYLSNGLGQELLRAHDWQWINKQYMITVVTTTLTGSVISGSTTMTVATGTISNLYGLSGLGINQATYVQSITDATHLELTQPATSTNSNASYTFGLVKFAMPSDFDHAIDQTEWDKSKHWRMLGPETAQQWEWLISGYISTGPRIRFRTFGNYFQIWPLVTTAEVLGFEYVSNGYALTAAGVAKSSFTLDSDTCVYNDRLMVLGLKKKYMEIKGFDTTAMTRDYMMELSNAKADDAGNPSLSFMPRVSDVLIGYENIPDSGFGT